MQNNANWVARHNNISFGGEFDYQNNPNISLPWAGVLNFTPGASSFPLRNTSSSSSTYNGYTALLEGVSFTSGLHEGNPGAGRAE